MPAELERIYRIMQNFSWPMFNTRNLKILNMSDLRVWKFLLALHFFNSVKLLSFGYRRDPKRLQVWYRCSWGAPPTAGIRRDCKFGTDVLEVLLRLGGLPKWVFEKLPTMTNQDDMRKLTPASWVETMQESEKAAAWSAAEPKGRNIISTINLPRIARSNQRSFTDR